MIGEQIKALRKFFGLNQAEFGAKIGLKGSSVSNYDVGRVSVPDSVILSICREYGCDETWLRTGEGTMFRERSWQEEVAKYFSEVLSSKGAGAEMQKMILEFFTKIPQDMWDELGEKAKEVLDNHREK